MRLINIELINYIGIYNGMGLNQMNVNFSICKSNKILIRGANGSGKSTLMAALHPFPDNNDKFIPNMEARKNMVYENLGIQYVIRYIHPMNNNGTRGTTKGYISKTIDGVLVELNASGNITSCKDLICEEFGLDPVFMSLAQLSSEDKGLVDKKPAERKKIINAMTNSLDTFNEIYRNISKRSSTLKSLITNITAKIGMLSDDSRLIAMLEALTKEKTKVSDNKDKAMQILGILTQKRSTFEETLKANNYDQINTEIEALTRDVSAPPVYYISKEKDPIVVRTKDDIVRLTILSASKINETEHAIDILSSKIPDIIAQRELEFGRLQDKQEKLKALESEDNFTEVKKVLDETQAKVTELENVFNQMGLQNISMITKDEFEAAMNALYTLDELSKILMSSYNKKYILEDLNNKNETTALILNLSNYKAELDSAKEEKSQLDKLFIQFQAKREVAAALANRPANCIIDTCIYIAEAVKADNEYPESKFIEISNRIKELDERIANLEQLINRANIASNIRHEIETIERELHSNIKFILKLPLRRDFEETYLSRVVEYDQFIDVKNLYPYIDCGNMIEEYKLYKEQLSIYQAKYSAFASKITLIDSIMQDISDLQEKTNSLAKSIEEINQSLLLKKKELENLKEVDAKIRSIYDRYSNEYLPKLERYNSLIAIKDGLTKTINDLEQVKREIEEAKEVIVISQNEFERISKEIEKCKYTISLRRSYEREYQQYMEESNVIEKIKYYSSPNTGISSIYIGIYMNKILNSANKFLTNLFGGEFTLLPFVVNESEFRIPCTAENGLMHDDISSTSLAQKSMLSLVISFALMNQASMKYNIICLDEIDGSLDGNNRSIFANILDSLMYMINCEQIFIISHNNEFDTSMADIISLKGAPIENGGNIIWKF